MAWLRGNIEWIIIGAAALGCAMILLVGETKRGLEYCKDAYPPIEYARKDEKKTFSEKPRVAKTWEQPLQSAIKTIDCKQPYGDDEYKMCQDWRTAKATADQACIAQVQLWTGMIIGGIGILGLIGTIVYAARSAYAAADTALITSESSRRELRAYLHYEFGHIVDLRTDGADPILEVVFKNFGATPAYDVSIAFNANIASPSTRTPSPTMPSGNFGIVGPSQHVNLRLPLVNPRMPNEAKDAIESGALAIHFHGIATYRDCFDKKQWTRFRLIYTGGVGGSRDGTMATCPDGNDAS